MHTVIENLKREINNHEKIQHSVLGQNQQWKNNHFEILSNIVNDDLATKINQSSENFFKLGNTISPITFKRIFEDQIKPSAYNDLRFLKTLEKICIFLGYENLNQYISLQKSKEQPLLSDEDYEKLKKLIKDCCTTEFYNMRTLFDDDYSAFDEFLIEGAPYIRKIQLYADSLRPFNVEFLEDHSNFEIYNYKIISIDKDMIVIETEEFWNLNFQNHKGIFPYHTKANQTYYLKRHKDFWRIWDNFNPDIGIVMSKEKPQSS